MTADDGQQPAPSGKILSPEEIAEYQRQEDTGIVMGPLNQRARMLATIADLQAKLTAETERCDCLAREITELRKEVETAGAGLEKMEVDRNAWKAEACDFEDKLDTAGAGLEKAREALKPFAEYAESIPALLDAGSSVVALGMSHTTTCVTVGDLRNAKAILDESVGEKGE